MLVTVLLCNSWIFSKSFLKSHGYLNNHWINTRHVCSYFNAFWMTKSAYGNENLNFDLFWCPFKNLNQLVALDSCMERVVWKCAMSALIWCQIWRFQLLIGCLSEIHWTLGMKCQGSATFANYHKFGENKTIDFTGVIVSIPSKSVWKSIDETRALWCPGIRKGYGAL